MLKYGPSCAVETTGFPALYCNLSETGIGVFVGTGVLVRVAVGLGGIGELVAVGVFVSGTGVLVRVAVGLGGTGELVAVGVRVVVGGIGLLVGTGESGGVPHTRTPLRYRVTFSQSVYVVFVPS